MCKWSPIFSMFSAKAKKLKFHTFRGILRPLLAQGVFEENDPNLKLNKKIVAFGCTFSIPCGASFLLSYYSLLMNFYSTLQMRT